MATEAKSERKKFVCFQKNNNNGKLDAFIIKYINIANDFFLLLKAPDFQKFNLKKRWRFLNLFERTSATRNNVAQKKKTFIKEFVIKKEKHQVVNARIWSDS